MFICAMNPSWYTQTEFAYQYGFRETASRFFGDPIPHASQTIQTRACEKWTWLMNVNGC